MNDRVALTGDAAARARTFAYGLGSWCYAEAVTRRTAASRLGLTFETFNRCIVDEVDPATLSPSTMMQIQRVTGLSDEALGLSSAGDASRETSENVSPSLSGARPWRIGLARAGDDWRVTLTAAPTRMTPEEAVELACELFREAGLARAGR